LIEVRAGRLIAVGLAVPMPPEAEHSYPHAPATANDWHVRRYRTVDERTALLHQLTLNVIG
jgi:hypothetical protein